MEYHRITLQQIEYFNAVAKHLNFTEAAKTLYISQPSLSKQISLLEAEIGVQLLYRTKRDVRLTAAGAFLYKELGLYSGFMKEVVEKTRRVSMNQSGSLNIGVLESMDTNKFLPGVIGNFKQMYPGVSVSVERHSFRILRENLIGGDCDLIFTLSFELDDSLGVRSNIVYSTTISVIVSKSHPLAARSNLTLSDLSNEEFVIISRSESPKGFDAIIEFCKENGFTPKIVKQLRSIESILSSVEVGVGIALVDSSIRVYENPHFKIFSIEDSSIELVVAWREANQNPLIPLFTEGINSMDI